MKRPLQLIGYHYSSEAREAVLTKNLMGIKREVFKHNLPWKKLNKAPYKYEDTVSFFLSEIPRDVVKLMGHTSKVWVGGNEIFEHEILIREDQVMNWNVESTPMQLAYIEDNYPDDPSRASLTEYYINWDKYARENGLRGHGLKDLLKSAKSIDSDLTPYFKLMIDQGSPNQYATTVPHIILETKKPILPISVKHFTL